ncbi:hypothetical protein A1O1_02779 [Capronia coronata CBS 617.96]|uniref:Uncharacterized protein n=1 Tax=Capronia coronata CBS 617.96 TaxID=1182541 RepID=W9YXJ8_9EURO|nr:uncharacterized protein A1O1_02779 [Capronia coronata CBS 617.96]EXJ94385.1 hypothetical protein A1O1_02779 [Capronia coronata CBS 617.96]
MDTGLKKLWSRRRSKGHDGMQDSGVGSLRKSQSTDKSGRSSKNSPRATQGQHYSIDHASSAASPMSTATSAPRLGFAGRMQAIPDGTSRPSTSVSRPDTSGTDSLMSAVNRAADAIAISDQHYRDSEDVYSKTHLRTKAPRYVDIFAVTTSDGMTSPSKYNEDVAERNLNLTQVALESSRNGYFSSSKYQEDVAIRNASPTSPSTISAKASPSAYQEGFVRLHPTERPNGVSSRIGEYPRLSRKPEDRPIWTDQNMQGPNGSHFRQQSDRTFEGHQAQDATLAPGHQLKGLALTTEDTSHMSLIGPNGSDATAYRSLGPIVKHAGSRPSQEIVRNQTLRSYQLPPSDVSQTRPSEPPQTSQSKSASYMKGTTSSQGAAYPVRSPSSLSNGSSVRRAIKLPNRTILDLTGDDSDVFSEITPESNYSSSPVIGNATLDTLRRIPGSAVIGPTTEDRTTVSSSPRANTTSTLSDEVRIEASQLAQSEQFRDGVSESLARDARARYPRSTSAFSAVNTIATSSPRASVVLEALSTAGIDSVTEGHGQTNGSTAEQQVVTEKRPLRQPSIEKESTEDKESAETQAEAGRRSIRQASVPRSEATVNGSAAMSQQKQEAVPDKERPQASESTTSYLRETSSRPSLQPHSHDVPSDGLHANDQVGANSMPGVITRDFANMATRSTLSSVPEDTESDGAGRAKRPQVRDQGRSQSHDPSHGRLYHAGQVPRYRPPIFASTIDEAELARKQDEARAALIRLQESLNETFLDSAPAPVVRSSSRAGVSGRTMSPHRSNSAASSSIFARVRNRSPIPPEIKVETDESAADGRSETSYHNLTTLRISDGSGSSGLAGQHNQERQTRNEKGKQKVEAGPDPNGPGPPVFTHEIDSRRSPSPSLPLPSLLLDKGHDSGPHYGRQQQPPPSPGEISLSSFPIPVSSPQHSATRPTSNITGPSQASSGEQQQQHTRVSMHSRQSSSNAGMRRQSSQRSQSSSASAFSIPYHMIPGRSSSIRDQSVAEY